MSVALPVRTRRLGSHLEPVIRREADAPSAAQRIIEKLVEPMLNVELRIDPREITHRVCGLAGLGRIIRITHAASEADVLAHLRFEKDPVVSNTPGRVPQSRRVGKDKTARSPMRKLKPFLFVEISLKLLLANREIR